MKCIRNKVDGMSIKEKTMPSVLDEENKNPIGLIEKLKQVGFDYSLTVRGDSMYPTIKDGQEVRILSLETVSLFL